MRRRTPTQGVWGFCCFVSSCRCAGFVRSSTARAVSRRRSETHLFYVLLCHRCISMVMHVFIGESGQNYATREKSAEGSHAWYRTGACASLGCCNLPTYRFISRQAARQDKAGKTMWSASTRSGPLRITRTFTSGRRILS